MRKYFGEVFGEHSADAETRWFFGFEKAKVAAIIWPNSAEIDMLTVMRVLEGPIAMVPCVSLNFCEQKIAH